MQAEITAALDWWREAGVDAVYSDEPQSWLADPKETAKNEMPEPVRPPKPEPVATPKIGGPLEDWPQDLEGFQKWWLTEPSLDEGGLAPRVGPKGEAGAELMVVVAMPEETDRDALLTGPQGKLLDGFLRAAGLTGAHTYKAAALPRYTPLADWAGLEHQGMGAILAHHVKLAQPKRLLVLGINILPLCGHDPAQGAQNLRSFNHQGGRVPALYEVGLERLLKNWQLRAQLWKRWLEWTDGDAWREEPD